MCLIVSRSGVEPFYYEVVEQEQLSYSIWCGKIYWSLG